MDNNYSILLAPNPSPMTGPGTNTILLSGRPEGAFIIDPGDNHPQHLDAIIQAGKAGSGFRGILITHGHPDHITGAEELRQRLHIPIYAFSKSGTPIADEEIADGTTWALGDETLRALHTPGHRFDHLCFLLERQRILFAGDLLAGTGTVVISPPEGDLLDYLTSLHRLQQLELVQIVPAHGPTIEQPRAKLAEYIAHRLQREQQILAALHTQPDGCEIPTIVEHIYVDVDPMLHPVAARSVEAHLIKLEREGRVRRQGEKWTLQGDHKGAPLQ